jgi:hypothetical protein
MDGIRWDRMSSEKGYSKPVGREGTGTKQSVCLHTAFLRKGISRDE